MKLSNATNIHATSNIAENAEFGMDQKDMPHITNILRNQMYSDKLLAILREYSTNAYDAHADKGIQNIPIEVTFPTVANQTLTIRDFGDGLTEDEVMEIYIKYGASTKRNSNAFTGCLGIGCKSGFAYSTQFTITSYKNNRKQSYLAKINEHNVGTISKTIDTNTDESNGVEISIPIKSSDHEDLRNKGLRLFRFWKTIPKTNIEIEPVVYKQETTDYGLIDKELSSTYWKAHNTGAGIFMGNIMYPINTSILNCDKASVNSVLNCSNVVLFAPLGSIDIAASREAIEYTDKTKNMIINLALKVSQSLSKSINDELDTITSPVQAAITAQGHLCSLDYDLRRVIGSGLKWNNQRLLTNIEFDKHVVKHCRLHRYRANDYVNKREKDIKSSTLLADMFFCEYDPQLISESNATRRIRTLQNNRNWAKDDMFFLLKKGESKLTTPVLTKEDVIDLHTIDPLPVNRTTITKADGTTVKKVKISVCKLQPSSLKSNRLSEDTDPEPHTDGKYYYIPLDRYDWMGLSPATDPLSELNNITQSLKHMTYLTSGSKETPTIYGVKKHHLKKLDENWINLHEHLTSLYKKVSQKFTQEIKEAIMRQSKSTYKLNLNHTLENVYSKVNCPLLNEIARVDKYSRSNWYDDYVTEERKLAEVINYIVLTMMLLGIAKQTDDRVDLENKIVNKYPLFKHITTNYYVEQEDMVAEFNDYINLRNNK